MAVLKAGRPHVQAEPTCRVDNALPPGRWRMALVVVDDAGQRSAPAYLTLTVTDSAPPCRARKSLRARIRAWLSRLARRIGALAGLFRR